MVDFHFPDEIFIKLLKFCLNPIDWMLMPHLLVSQVCDYKVKNHVIKAEEQRINQHTTSWMNLCGLCKLPVTYMTQRIPHHLLQ